MPESTGNKGHYAEISYIIVTREGFPVNHFDKLLFVE